MLNLFINGTEELRIETTNVEPVFMVAGDGCMKVVNRVVFINAFNRFYESYVITWNNKLKKEYETIAKFLKMQRLTMEQWHNVFNNLDSSEDVEILWLDSTNEWALCSETELFEDGFKTKREAIDRIELIESLI